MNAACIGFMSVPRCRTTPVTATNSNPVRSIHQMPHR